MLILAAAYLGRGSGRVNVLKCCPRLAHAVNGSCACTCFVIIAQTSFSLPSIPLKKSRNTLSRFMLRKPGIGSGVLGHWLVISYDPYGPARAVIAKLLRKSPYEGRTRWREQGRKKPSGPARIAYGPHTGIFSIVLQ